ncbi:Oidioi.mRNA.OKI2018_I69.chr2.g7395.t1.cds [Oikopleura dioica]|uniref:Oidioi.mRNA.OKI2018_I69.chr2.g7395.t1.cds n=1 Tax=Oikopleura dioica TaxID=34765 RepID=A0ABN7TF23_OIKDI|nr:Oidioi.mRNA.OKI2018_I69.chr2.g7395.t1.cds [Oikopleura dioica]
MSNAPDKASTVDCSELDSIRTPSEFQDNQSNSSGLSDDDVGRMIKQTLDPVWAAIHEINKDRFTMISKIKELEEQVKNLTNENANLKNEADTLRQNDRYFEGELEKLGVENQQLKNHSKELRLISQQEIIKTEIFVGPLPQDMKKEDIKRVFEEFGEVQQIKRDSVNKRNCSIIFKSEESVEKALQRRDLIVWKSQNLNIQRAVDNKGKEDKRRTL